MDCPRCGEDLIHYSLGDAETWSCERCRYSGIPVDHGSDGTAPESWDECLRRFYGGTADRRTADESAAERPQCAAQTASGDRCSRRSKRDARYCSQHRGMIDRDGPEAVVDHDG